MYPKYTYCSLINAETAKLKGKNVCCSHVESLDQIYEIEKIERKFIFINLKRFYMKESPFIRERIYKVYKFFLKKS